MATTNTNELRKTKGYAILNEATLQIERSTDTSEATINENALLFETEQAAEEYASGKCELWQIIEIAFEHKFIHHNINQSTKFEEYHASLSKLNNLPHLNNK
tara:strand:+ start:2452 stop:2757 length:306 start_codon:yes stop_codon:yes gene_type:complete